MKKKLLIILISVSFITYASIQATNDSNGKNGYVGAPGESTCASSGCHNDNAANSGAGGIAISSSNMSSMQYTPGQTYHISISISEGGKSLFGFGFEALDTANNNVGTIIVTKSTETNLHNSSYLGGTNPAGRINIGHIKNGGAANNNKTFNFDWKAPSNYTGNINFYAVGNAANNDGLASGDNIYTTSITATPASTALLTQVSSLWPFNAFVSSNSAGQKIYVSGEYLSGNITVSAPSGYEASFASSTGYTSSVTLSTTSGSLRLTPVYIRLKPSSAGAVSGNVTITGGGATSLSVAVTGSAYSSGSSQLTLAGNVVPFGIAVGNNSASQQITIIGSNLTANAIVSVTAPFKVASTQGGSYGSSVNLSPVSGSIAPVNVFIKYYPTTSGSQTGTLSVSSTGATTQNLSLSGTSNASNASALYIQPNFDPFVSNSIGTASAAQSFQVDAVIPFFNVVIAAPTHFEISTNASSGYSSLLTLTPTNKLITGQIIYIRYKPVFAGTEYEDFNIASPTFGSKFISVVGYIAKAQGSLSITISGTDTICAGNTSTLTGSGATSYSWQPGNLSGASVNVSPSSTTTYTATGTTGTQTAQAQFTVYVMPKVKASFNNIAFDSSVTFTNTSSNATSYIWDFGDGQTASSPNPNHIYATVGTYKVLITAKGYCGTDTVSQVVNIKSGVVANGLDRPYLSRTAIYPNPASRNIYIDINGKATIKLYSIDGRLVYTTPILNSTNSPYHLVLPELKSGMYVISILKNDGEIYEEKLMLEN